MTINQLNISEACKLLIETNVGYRNDHYSTGHYSIDKVITFETEELGNEDIFETCLKLYGTNNVHDIIKNHFPNHDIGQLWGLWLTTEQGVIKWYKGDEEGYNKYSIPNNALIISDLDDEGILLVLDNHPKHYIV